MKKLLILVTLLASLTFGFKYIPVTYGFNIYDLDRYDFPVMVYNKIMVYVLDNIADENDTIVLHIDSHGGSVLSGFDIVNSVLNTKAFTVGHIKSGALSAGAMIAVATDYIIAENYSSILFHKARICSPFGKCIVVDHIVTDKYLKEKVRPYLTAAEYKAMLEGKDVEILGKHFAMRFNYVNRKARN